MVLCQSSSQESVKLIALLSGRCGEIVSFSPSLVACRHAEQWEVRSLDVIISFAKQIFCGIVIKPIAYQFLWGEWESECIFNCFRASCWDLFWVEAHTKARASTVREWRLNPRLLISRCPSTHKDEQRIQMKTNRLNNQTSPYRSVIMLILCNYLLSEIEMFLFRH